MYGDHVEPSVLVRILEVADIIVSGAGDAPDVVVARNALLYLAFFGKLPGQIHHVLEPWQVVQPGSNVRRFAETGRWELPFATAEILGIERCLVLALSSASRVRRRASA